MKPKTRTEPSESSRPKVINSEIEKELSRLKKRMYIANKSKATMVSYVRSVQKLSDFYKSNPRHLELDEIIDYLVHLKDDLGLQWRTIKLYVAGLRFYYQEMVEEAGFALKIPYPKEKPSLPQVMSREELKELFDGCINYKHKVMFRLMYSSGLRRNELLNLKIIDIDSKDGHRRIRINNGKGGKDRYTILSHKILKELRIYFRMCKPKEYLFNGQQKGTAMSSGGLRHALDAAVKRSGLKRTVTPHLLRHCFASHALEDGLNIKTLQHMLGHQSLQTTLLYLHVSEVPLSKAFSPLDKWEEGV